MDALLLEILCCPVTHQPLREASAGELAAASARVAEPLEEGLIRQDGTVLYPIRHGIPLLLAEEGISI